MSFFTRRNGNDGIVFHHDVALGAGKTKHLPDIEEVRLMRAHKASVGRHLIKFPEQARHHDLFTVVEGNGGITTVGFKTDNVGSINGIDLIEWFSGNKKSFQNF